jgi:LmbE family N-acetylglucosaminyl deacetylase
MRAIFISPHFDDAVFSCGGLIARISDKLETHVWTIFSGKPILPRTSPLIRWLHNASQSPNADSLNSTRKTEDLQSLSHLTAKSKHLGFLDSVYRVDFFLRPLYQNSCITTPHPSEAILVRSISKKLNSLLKATDLVFSPLAIGHHVDHLIARQAIEATPPHNLYYFEDVPYNLKSESRRLEKPEKCHPFGVHLKAENLHQWKRANAEYVSQLAMVDPNSDQLDTYLSRFRESHFPLLTTTSAAAILHQLLPES